MTAASAGLLLTTVVGLVWTAAAAPIHIVLSVIDECANLHHRPGPCLIALPACLLLPADLLLVPVALATTTWAFATTTRSILRTSMLWLSAASSWTDTVRPPLTVSGDRGQTGQTD